MNRAALLLLLSIPLPTPAAPPGYRIDTLAGSANVGDGGPATQAFFSAIEGIARGADGSLYVADTGDHRIRRVTPGGQIQTLAGVGAPGYSGDGGPAAAAALNAPYGLAIDPAGRLFLADLGNGVVRVIQPGGSIATAAGGAQRLRAPRNVAVDPAGNLYVSEFSGQQVSRVNSDGSLTPVAGNAVAGFSGDGGAATDASLRYPAGIAFDAAGSLYIADSGNHRVRLVRQGICSTVAGPGAPGAAGRLALDTPTGVAVDPAGNLYVAHAGVPGVWKIAPDSSVAPLDSPVPVRAVLADSAGVLAAGAQQVQQLAGASLQSLYGALSRNFGDGGVATRARLGSPTAVAVDAAGRVAIADTAFDRLRLVQNGTITSSPADVAAPAGLAFDAAGALLVADAGHHLLQSLPSGGTPRTLAGSGLPGISGAPGQAALAAIGDPSALTLDSYGRVYFSSAHRVFQLLPSGYLQIVAGTGTAGYNGDGDDAATRQLNGPAGLAADALGNLWIADTGNHLLRRLTPAGALVTVAGTLAAGFAGDEAPLGAASFSSPAGLAVSAAGELWIADSGNHRLRMVDADGLLHTIAGTGTPGFSGDGGSAAAAGLFRPMAVAVAPSGVVYVADTGNRRVRTLTPPALDQFSAPPGPLAVVHAASAQPTPVAPGLLVSLYGRGLGPAEPVAGQFGVDGRLAAELGGTQVTFNGVPAPLLYVSAAQINAQVPYQIAGRTAAVVEVRRNSLPRAAAAVAVQPAVPGFFVDAAHNIAAWNADGTLNGPAHPAPRGSIVLLFATGDGLEDAGLTQAPVAVTIGGYPADVLYAGAAPGFAGLMQINARVPLHASGALAVLLTVGAASTAPGPVLQVGP